MKTVQKNQAILTVMAVAIGTFMSALDTSIVNIAVPIIQSNLKVSLSLVEWLVTAYLLIVSSVLLTFGRLSDIYGHKKLYCTGFIVFTIGSLMCGLSSSIQMLIGCRVFQALGAAMIFSTGTAIITNAVSAENRGKALSVSAMAVAISVCTGPVLGGFLATLAGWQSIFFINVPIGIIGSVLAFKNIPADAKKEHVPFDIIGSIMIFTALMLILFPLDIAGKADLNLVLFWGMLLAGLFMAVCFILFERRSAHPMLNMDLFKNRVFTASNIAALFNYMAQFIMIFLAPFYLEKLRMLPATVAGMLYIPMPIATLIVAPISGSISDRFDSRYISSIGMGIMAIGIFMLSFIKVNTPYLYFIIILIIIGLGSGLFQTPNNSAVMGNVPQKYRGTASGTLATMRNIGMVLGVAVSGALFSFNLNNANVANTTKGLKGLQLQQVSFTYALHITFMFASLMALFAMIASFTKGEEKSKVEKVVV